MRFFVNFASVNKRPYHLTTQPPWHTVSIIVEIELKTLLFEMKIKNGQREIFLLDYTTYFFGMRIFAA